MLAARRAAAAAGVAAMAGGGSFADRKKSKADEALDSPDLRTTVGGVHVANSVEASKPAGPGGRKPPSRAARSSGGRSGLAEGAAKREQVHMTRLHKDLCCEL